MVGDPAASGLAHLYPDLAFAGGAGLDQGLVISALGATRWEAGRLQARIGAADVAAVHGVTKIRFAAWPGRGVPTRSPRGFRTSCHAAARAWSLLGGLTGKEAS